ncbi:MAG: S8 family serine peptidase [Verrucomicrobiota bacterium]
MTNKLARRIFYSLFLGGISVARSSDLDTIGVTLLREIDVTLVGSGVKVAQPEAAENVPDTAWQVNPAVSGQPTNLFTYISSDGIASNYPNALGIESGHANGVAANFFGISTGVAPGINHVDNYEANYFFLSKILTNVTIAAKIVNQSFIFTDDLSTQIAVNVEYDRYAAQKNVLFISGVGNSGPPSAPSTAYNGIGVGAFGGDSSVGPTPDNQRSKPDITAPAGATSFSAPLVAGGAAILAQAALRGDGGVGTTNAAFDSRTLKTLLLNGAVKPSNWTHTSSAPLDPRYGAGVLNVFNSYKQLAAGKHLFIESTTTSEGGLHFPGNNSNNLVSLVGWDFNSIANNPNQDRANHYYFSLPASTMKTFTLTATLAWNRQVNQTDINDLDLFLYDTSNSNLVAASTSRVDNVEHIFNTNLPAGRYDLQVLKKGGEGTILNNETYALAFETFALSLSISRTGTNVVLTWPIAPTGFTLQSSTNLNSLVSWMAVTNAPVMTTNQNNIVLGAATSAQFFRLVRP